MPQKIHLIDGRRLLDIMALIKNSGENNHYINVSGAALTNQLKAGLRSDPDLIFKGLLAMIDRQKSADETHRIISKWWDEHYRNKPEKH